MPDNRDMNTNQIAVAAQILGSQAALARALSVAPPTVHQWIDGTRGVPVRYCVEIERLTDGKVSRQKLRPDDFWRIWPDLPAPAAVEAKP